MSAGIDIANGDYLAAFDKGSGILNRGRGPKPMGPRMAVPRGPGHGMPAVPRVNPTIKPGATNRSAVDAVKNATGKGNNITVKTQQEAEAILEKARPNIPWTETYGPKSKIGKEVHPVDGSGAAPGHDVELPHIKRRDWTGGKANGAEGHIYFESVNGKY